MQQRLTSTDLVVIDKQHAAAGSDDEVCRAAISRPVLFQLPFFSFYFSYYIVPSVL